MKLKGKKISEVSQRFDLTGKELLPFAQDGENGSMSIDTIASYAYDKEGGDFTSRLAYDVQVPGVELIADRAEKDALGNIITNTYLTRSGAKKAMNEALKEQLPDAIANIDDGFVTPNMLSEETKQLFGAETITNFPDNEDITVNASNQLTLADKEYNPITYSGMGRKKLRKNMINGVNTLTQNMLNKQNTIYVIQYDFDLNGEEITIPEGCVLDFQGGGFSNGKIKATNIVINGREKCLKNIFFTEDSYSLNNIFYTNWFDVDNTGVELCTYAIQSIFNLKIPHIVFSEGVYAFNSVNINYSCIIESKGLSTLIGQPKNEGIRGIDHLFKFHDTDKIEIKNFIVNSVNTTDYKYSGSKFNHGLFYFNNVNNIVINSIYFRNVHLGKGEITDIPGLVDNAVLVLCTDCNNIFIEKCEIYDCDGGERILITPINKSRELINVVFKENYIHDEPTTGGNTPLTALANKITIENNIVENWYVDMSLFNTFGYYVYINNNIITNAFTSSVFDCSEYGELENTIVVATNNYIECENCIAFLTSSKNLTIKDNYVKGISLIGDAGKIIKAVIENNFIDSTYYDIAKISGTRHAYYSSISLNSDIENSYIYIKNNRIIHYTNDNLNIYINNTFRGIYPIKCYLSNKNLLEISNNTIEGDFPVLRIIGSSSYYSPMLINIANENNADVTTVDYIKIHDNKIKSLSSKNISNLCCACIHLNKGEYGLINNIIVTNNNRNNDDITQLISNNKIAIKDIFCDKINLKGIPFYTINEGSYNYDYRGIPYILAHQTLKGYTFSFTSIVSTCVYNRNKNEIGSAIKEGDVINFDNKCYQLLFPSITLTEDIVTNLLEENSSPGTIIKVNNVYWRRCNAESSTNIKDNNIKDSYNTTDRNALNLNDRYHKGVVVFDTFLNKPVWWTGTKWVDATGADV